MSQCDSENASPSRHGTIYYEPRGAEMLPMLLAQFTKVLHKDLTYEIGILSPRGSVRIVLTGTFWQVSALTNISLPLLFYGFMPV